MAVSIALPTPRTRAGRAGAGMRRWADRFMRAGLEPVSPASAAVFRIIFGVLGLAAAVRFVARGWISELYLEPAHHLGYYGFGWVQAWPGWGMYLHFALLGLASLGVALGYRYRLSIAAFFLLFTYVELIDRTTYLNHYYLVSLVSLLMIFLPLDRALSLDARRTPSDSVPRTIPRSVLWLLMAQVGLVYLFAGIAKLNSDWLFQAQPLRIWLYNSAGVPLIGPLLRETWVAYAMSWGGMLFDLTIVGWLLWRRTRPLAYAALAVFHVATALLFPSIGMFPWVMLGATLIFFGPDWPARFVHRIRRRCGRQGVSSTILRQRVTARPLSWQIRAACLVAVVFLTLQVGVPLRHLAYPGNVRWTEEGYRFSWRVLLTEKTGLVHYRVSGLTLGGERLVCPGEYLTPGQVERMAYQPDLILATAHIIRDDFAAKGHQGVEVRTDAYVSYNGRPAARLIDPEVNLATVRPGIGVKDWILRPPE